MRRPEVQGCRELGAGLQGEQARCRAEEAAVKYAVTHSSTRNLHVVYLRAYQPRYLYAMPSTVVVVRRPGSLGVIRNCRGKDRERERERRQVEKTVPTARSVS